jgi:transcriptional regulator with XRE-family HTH domain
MLGNLGDFICSKRQIRGWSQRKLADFSGFSFTVIQRIESGEAKNVTLDTLKGIAQALEIPIQDLIIASEGIDPDEKPTELEKAFYHQPKPLAPSTRGDFINQRKISGIMDSLKQLPKKERVWLVQDLAASLVED